MGEASVMARLPVWFRTSRFPGLPSRHPEPESPKLGLDNWIVKKFSRKSEDQSGLGTTVTGLLSLLVRRGC